jgi:UDP-GlcNAc:undecaprenyl-phosphate/decaprenyl-phosphate GlcNAc-1-phosphate transferase
LELILFFSGGVVASLVINGLLLRFSRSLGIRNANDVTIRWSNESKPSLGGISMYITFIFGLLAYAVVFDESDVFGNNQIVGLLTAGTLAFLIGIADDAYDTKPLLKLLGQITCGVILVYTDTILSISHSYWMDAVFTVFWVVVIMNSLNMLDNMDGITATVCIGILISSLFGSCMLHGSLNNVYAIVGLTLIGGVIGFLRYNIHPSRMFMGDTGSQFISLIVSFYAIHFLWNQPHVLEMPSWTGLLIALAAFTPAAVDTLTVVVNRIRRGKSPMIGGKDHTTHHLVYMGWNDFKVWILFVGLTIASSILSVSIIYTMHLGFYWLSLVAALFFIGVFVALYRVTIKYKALPEKKNNAKV